MSRLTLLILDANVVIKLFELGCWAQVVEKCDIHLSRTVVEQEAQFFRNATSDERVEIDLSADITADRIHVFDVGLAELEAFRGQFNVVYLEKLDPGESESLAYLVTAGQDHGICSADSIVYASWGGFIAETKGSHSKRSCKRSAGRSDSPNTTPGSSTNIGRTRGPRK